MNNQGKMGLFGISKKSKKVEADKFYTKGQWQQALAAYEKVVEEDPDNLKMIGRVADTHRTTAVISKDDGELLKATADSMEPQLKLYPEIRTALQESSKKRAESAVAKFLEAAE